MKTQDESQVLKSISEVIARIGTDEFVDCLDNFVSQIVDFDLTAIFAYSQKQLPILLHDGFRGHGTPSALKHYLEGTYLLDAVYQSAIENKNTHEGLFRMRQLAPDNFFTSDYVHSWAVHPCVSRESGALAEEIVFFSTLSCGAIVAYSIMRSNDKLPFNDDEYSRLKSYEEIICNAIERNWVGMEITESDYSTKAWYSGAENIRRGFDTFASNKLTTRETTVVKLTLQGHSIASIANNMSITPGTVKNHKKNIYIKLDISNVSELFSLFINHICYVM